MGLLRSKKADVIGDVIMFVVILFALGLASLVIYPMFTEVNDDVQADSDMTPQTKSTMSGLVARYPAFIDGAFILVFILLSVAVIVASYFLDSHPLFFIIVFIMLVVTLLIGATLSNAHMELMEDSDFSTLSATFPNTHWLMSHFVEMILFEALLVVVAVYGKAKMGGGL